MLKHADSDVRVLMPRSAAPARPARRPAHKRVARDARGRDEREFATLEAQLAALDRDIEAARGTARRAATAPGRGLRSRRDQAAPRLHGERVRLRDGAEIIIRPVEPDDAPQLKAAFESLSAVSRYRRFLAPIDDLSPAQLSYLTHVDHTSHEAVAAFDAETAGGIGIARYVCDADDKKQAEVAIVVADAWQSRGVGTALFERLIARARSAGVERITARMIVGNDAARRIITHAADAWSEERQPGTIVLTARLRG
jgi:GNAT superfamily N-acetyltransferase